MSNKVIVLGSLNMDLSIAVDRMPKIGETLRGYEMCIRDSLSTEMMNAVLVSGHGPFVWGDCIDNAVENALVLEYIAEMAYHRECLNQTPKNLLSQEILKKHYFRKHGKDAYYGQ